MLPVSVLGFDLEEKYSDLNDTEFEKMRMKHNAEWDIYGITSVLKYSSEINKDGFMKQIHEHLTKKALELLDEASFKRFIKTIEKTNVGLFVNEWFANLPLILIPELLKNIPEDIDFTQTCDDVPNLKDFKFEYLLCISR